jgi:hypothetical protein
MVKSKINRENIGEHLVRYQLEMVGKTWEEALADNLWYSNWTMTQEQHDEFKKYAIPLIKKIFKCNKERANRTFAWFDLQFGLRIKE